MSLLHFAMAERMEKIAEFLDLALQLLAFVGVADTESLGRKLHYLL